MAKRIVKPTEEQIAEAEQLVVETNEEDEGGLCVWVRPCCAEMGDLGLTVKLQGTLGFKGGLENAELYIYAGDMPIKHCPQCGRKIYTEVIQPL